MTKAATAARSGWHWRTILFRVVAVASALAFLNLGGVTSIMVPWGDPGFPFRDFTPEIHRWHSAILGVTEAILLPGLLLALLWRPVERPLLMQFFIFVGVALVVPHFLIRGRTPISSAFLVFPVLSYPALRSLLSFPRVVRPRGFPTPALALIIVGPLAFDFWRNLQAQLTGIGGEHARHGHWATACSLDLVLAVMVLFALSKAPGARALGWLAGISLVYLGIAAISLPEYAGSWGIFGGVLAIVGGLGLVGATWWVNRVPRVVNFSDSQMDDPRIHTKEHESAFKKADVSRSFRQHSLQCSKASPQMSVITS